MDNFSTAKQQHLRRIFSLKYSVIFSYTCKQSEHKANMQDTELHSIALLLISRQPFLPLNESCDN
jgi:hypothetical protein